MLAVKQPALTIWPEHDDDQPNVALLALQAI
jgi:hypothetical protein